MTNRPWIPVLLAVLLLSPWPILALGLKPGLQANLVAIPTDGITPADPVSAVFSRARHFIIVDLHTGRFWRLDNPYLGARHAAGLRCAYMLLEERIGVALARHMGPEPYTSLTAKGVWIFGTNSSTVQDAAVQYARGDLVRLFHPTAPPHYGLEKKGLPVPGGTCPLTDPSAAGSTTSGPVHP